MKKFLFVIILFLFLPTIVFARPADPDRFPKTTPLLPPPENFEIDEEGFFSSPPKEQSFDYQTGEGKNRQDVVLDKSPGQTSDSGEKQAGRQASSGEARLALVFAFAIILGYAVYRWKVKNKG